LIEKELSITLGQATVEGNLTVPHNARGIVLFAHGSGSGRFSPRNQYVAKEFNKSRIGTLLFDLLTSAEEEEDLITAEYRFNIPLLADRLVGATEWLKKSSITHSLKLAYFGASTGAAAALVAAAKLPNDIVTVVSRGGRPDLAEQYLPKVKAPTLLLVGDYDEEVIELNKQAIAKMTAEKKLVIIPGATHLFEEPGKLEEVGRISTEWFLNYLK
jgi:putative phosphoribosyl transferase